MRGARPSHRFRPGPLVRVGLLLALPILAAAPPARAQSIVTGDVLGRIVDPAGAALQGALVTLREPGEIPVAVATADAEGRFVFSFVVPGRYQVLAEALGRRPVLVASLRVEPGRATLLELPLEPAAPPVERRDTLRHAGLPDAIGGTLAWADPHALRSLPDEARDLSYLASLTTLADEGLGFEGLPERFTRVYADGQPFVPARYPGSEGDPARGLVFPNGSIAHVSAFPGTSDVEWDGAAGGYLALSTGVNRPGAPELFGLWSADPLWSADAFASTGAETPSFSSFWAGGGATVQLVPDTARLHFAFEGSRRNRPLAPILTDSVARLVFPPAGGGASPLALSDLERTSTASGSATLEWALTDRGSLHARVSGATFSRERDALPSPELLYPGTAGAAEGADGAASANVVTSLSETVAIEVRGGASFSRRTFGPSGAQATGEATTVLLDPAVAFGRGSASGSEVRRTDLQGSAVLHLTTGPHRFKGGVQASHASHGYDLIENQGTFFFGRATGVRGPGLFVELAGTAPRVDFGVTQVGGFLQYRWNPVPAIILTAGTRADLEILPSDVARKDGTWEDLTGLNNSLYESRLPTFGALLHASWDLTGRSRTVLEAGVGLQQGDVDPAALHEVILNAGRLDVRRELGTLASWPTPPAAPATFTGRSLTLLDLNLKPPQTTRAALGLAHRIGGATTIRLSGTVRRTDYLLRRADLNVPVTSAGTSVNGGAVLAPLVLQGGVVSPQLYGWRRFPQYDQVWALNGDGWSRYRAVSIGVEQALPADGALFGMYTYSETRDNLLGLGDPQPGAALDPGLQGTTGEPWAEGVSDLDVPHRLSVGAVIPVSWATLTGVYRFRSGLPFTPMVRAGIDSNGDGSWQNDVAFVPDDASLDALGSSWTCLNRAAGSFPERNACRAPSSHRLDLRAAVGPLRLGTVPLELVVDVLNATDEEEGRPDDALLTLDPGRALEQDAQGRWRVPYRVNPGFGSLLTRTDPGRVIRLGARVGVR